MEKDEFKNYANSFQAIAKPGLENITKLMKYLGNPEKTLKFIHVAGTNGKGSVCAYLQSILTASGLKCGKYISPNMISVCERISIDGKEISETELNSILNTVKIGCKKTIEDTGVSPTQFEIWTAAAFLYFVEKKCDIVVLETGLGGRLDATNVIPSPLVSIITHIAADHTQYLGNTLEDIAAEKAGIIKKGGCTVCARQTPEVENVLKKAAKNMSNRFIIAEDATSESFNENGEFFSYKRISGLHSSLLGLHQLENATIAIETALYLKIDETAIRRGIEKAKNIGRFEIVSKAPLIVFDGAHNPDGMRTLKDSLARYFPNKSKSFIFASMSDKDIGNSLKILKSFSANSEFFAVAVKNNPRSLNEYDLNEILKKEGFNSKAMPDIKSALDSCSSDMIVICGSLYLYKDLSEIK